MHHRSSISTGSHSAPAQEQTASSLTPDSKLSAAAIRLIELIVRDLASMEKTGKVVHNRR